MKFKQWFVRGLGLLTTCLSIVLIYLILFKEGHLQKITIAVLVEFFVVISLTISTKFFWYTSTEDSVRSSEEYLTKRNVVVKTITDTVEDARDFDEFIEIENDVNYNKYVSNRCKSMTVENYKLSIFDKLHQLIYKKDKAFYMIRYMLSVERRANKLHKLSGSCIRSLTQSHDGLTDDRNRANFKKITFLWTGAVFSFVVMFVTATIAFTNKEGIDKMYAILKMSIYVSNILFSILQAILKARMTVAGEDISYFNRVLSILEKYESYKTEPKKVERVSYIPKEVTNGGNNVNSKERVDVNTDDRPTESAKS